MDEDGEADLFTWKQGLALLGVIALGFAALTFVVSVLALGFLAAGVAFGTGIWLLGQGEALHGLLTALGGVLLGVVSYLIAHAVRVHLIDWRTK